MARVPEYGLQKVNQAGPSGVGVQVDAPQDAFGAAQGRQAEALGQGLTNLSSGLQQAAHEANQSRVNDALNQLRETELDLTYGPDKGYTNLRGIDALQRPNNQSLSAEYGQQLQTRYDELRASLSNDQQRELFQQHAAPRLTTFRGNLMNYEGDQNHAYQLSVTEGTVATASKEIAAFYNDPNRIDAGVQSIRAAAYQNGKLRGLSAEEVKNNADKLVSGAHLGAVQQALAAGEPMYAEQYLRTYKEQMDPVDLLKARGAVDEVASVYIGNLKAQQLMTDYARAENPSDFDRVVAITQQRESGGQRYDENGQLLTSPAGAKGEMQVMDGTHRDPGFGVMPARDDSPDERARVGRDYLAAMVKRYNGNLAYAWAAYNAGPGAVDTALSTASKGAPGGWLAQLPKETQDYVQNNLREYAAGGGRGAAPTIGDLQNRLRSDPDLAARPGALQKATESLNRDFALHQQGRAQQRNQAYAAAMQAIEGGTRYDELPASIRGNIDPAKWGALRKYEEQVRNGGRSTSDLATYQLLAANPERLRSMSDEEFYATRQYLSESDFKKFSDMRGEQGSNSRTDPGNLDATMVDSLVSSRLQAIGLDPKAKSGAAAAQVGAIRKHINDVVLMKQQAAGRKFDDTQLTQLVDEQFLRTRNFKAKNWYQSMLGLEGTGAVRKVSLFGVTVSDIPPAVRTALENDLKAQGFEEPSEQQVLEAFYAGDFANAQ